MVNKIDSGKSSPGATQGKRLLERAMDALLDAGFERGPATRYVGTCRAKSELEYAPTSRIVVRTNPSYSCSAWLDQGLVIERARVLQLRQFESAYRIHRSNVSLGGVVFIKPSARRSRIQLGYPV